MSREVERMLNQLERSYRAEAWHGPSVLETLAGVGAAQAAARPVASAHTIWELVLHTTYWKDIVRRRLAGERPETDDALNFPVVRDASPEAWARALANLDAVHEALSQEIARLDDEQLEEPAPGGSTPRYVVIHGIVQHDLYHGGQIAILKKKPAVTAAPKKAAARKASGKAKKKVTKKAAKKATKKAAATRKTAGRKKKSAAKRGARPKAARKKK